MMRLQRKEESGDKNFECEETIFLGSQKPDVTAQMGRDEAGPFGSHLKNSPEDSMP